MREQFQPFYNTEASGSVFSYLWLTLLLPALFLIVYPVSIFESYNAKRFLQIYIVTIVHIGLFLPLIGCHYFSFIFRASFLKKISCFCFFLFGAISAFFSDFPLYAWGDLLHYFFLFNSVLILYCVFCCYRKLPYIVVLVFLVAFLVILIEFVVRCFIAINLDGYLTALLVYPNPGNIRFLNQIHVQLFFFFPLLAMCFLQETRKYIVLFSIVGVFMLAVGGSRGAFLSIFLCILFSSVFKNELCKKINRYSVLFIIFGLAIYLLYKYLYLYFLSADEQNTLFRYESSGRLSMWLNALALFQSNWVGIGPYHYGVSPGEFSFSHPHNSIVQVFLEWGVGAGLLFCLFFIQVVWRIAQVFSKSHDVITLGLAYTVLSALLYSLLSGVLVMPSSQILFVFFLGALMAKSSRFVVHEEITKQGIGLRAKSAVFFIMFVMFLPYVYYVNRSYGMQSVEHSLDGSVYYESIGPRMWSRGGIVIPNPQ